MDLDVRTILVMLAILAFMFAGLLELARLHAGNIRGIRQWSMANICLGLGLGLTYIFHRPMPGYEWAVVAGSTLVSIGVALQFGGIQSFKGERNNWPAASLIVFVIFSLNVWFAVLHPDVRLRSIANSIVYAAGYALCARALLVRIEPPLRTAYWFTGLSFAVLVAVLLARGATIWLSPLGAYAGIYSQLPINPLSFFIASIVQLCVTFGFILMLDYRLVADMQKLASRDALTGAFNRRRLEEEAVLQWARHLRTGDTLAIMLLDIDHFKSINDDYGHQTGDVVLIHLVTIAQDTIRADDYFARYGGDEFCILLPSTTEQEALVLAERLRQRYAETSIEFGGKSLKSTISIGIADSTDTGQTFSSLVAAADRALYRAKQDMRNRVVPHSTLDAAVIITVT